MKFRLFSEVDFEISYPVALIESYCFQSDFYSNYDLIPDRKIKDVNLIGARIPSKQLNECERKVDITRSSPIFKCNELGLDDFLALDDMTITKFAREDLFRMISLLMEIDGIGISRATKVLHTVFPNIVPMIDNMLREAYFQYGTNRKERNINTIFVAYYQNLKEQPTKNSLAEVYDAVSRNLPGLTKVRVFDILWWSYLKAKKLRDKHSINWATLQ